VPAWMLALAAVLTIIMSSAVSMLFAGMYVGTYQDRLDRVIQDQRHESDNTRQQFLLLSSSVNSLDNTMAGLTVEIKNLSIGIEDERQDRINFDKDFLYRGEHK